MMVTRPPMTPSWPVACFANVAVHTLPSGVAVDSTPQTPLASSARLSKAVDAAAANRHFAGMPEHLAHPDLDWKEPRPGSRAKRQRRAPSRLGPARRHGCAL